jgi:hypothetical protein
MAGLNLDDILSDFEGKPKSAPSKGLDIDSILSEFDSKPADIKPKAAEKVLNNGYGLGAPEDRFKPEFGSKEVPKTRRTLPTTNIEESIVDAFKSGRETFSEGLSDIGSNRPASGVGKVAMGALGTVVSPITGLIEGGVATPVADVTGSKRIGDTAGLVVGSGLPVVKGAAAVSGALPKNKALSTLVENIGRENLPSVVAALKANPRLAPADLSPRVLQDTQHLFANEGPQIDYLAKASASRMASSKAAVNDAYDTSGGVSPDLAAKVQELANAARKVGTEAIQPAIKDAKPVDITSTLAEIDKVLKPGVTSVISGESSLPLTNVKKELAQIKAMLGNDKEMRTNAADLHKFQSGLRTTAESLMRSATAADKEMGKSLMNVRNNLVADIDAASGGKYKPALSSYRDEMHIADSFRDGYEGVFSSSKKMENDPSFTKKWFDGLTDAEKQAAREGARARIATEIGTARNPALAGESFSRSDFNQEKLATLFGKEEAAKLIKTLQEERTIANTHNKIIEGSQTAMRTASKSQFALPTPTEVMKSTPAVAAAEASSYFMGGMPGVGAGLLAGAKVAAKAKDVVKMKLAREHNARYAQYALPTEGPSRDALIAALEAQIPGPKPSLATRGANALSRIVAP